MAVVTCPPQASECRLAPHADGNQCGTGRSLAGTPPSGCRSRRLDYAAKLIGAPLAAGSSHKAPITSLKSNPANLIWCGAAARRRTSRCRAVRDEPVCQTSAGAGAHDTLRRDATQ